MLTRVFKLRDKLVEALRIYVGVTLTGPSFDDFVESMLRALPPSSSFNAVYHSARVLAGRELSASDLRNLCWRIAGNVALLRRNTPVLPWSAPSKPELAPAQIMDYRFTTTTYGHLAGRYTVRFLSGRACPLVVSKVWSRNFVRYLAQAVFGFTACYGNYPFQSDAELVRLRFMAEIDPQYCRDDLPGFDRLASSSGVRQYNRFILRARAREDYKCPIQASHPCFQCHIGYDQCLASTHPRTWLQKTCELCHKEAAHDPANKAGICIRCEKK